MVLAISHLSPLHNQLVEISSISLMDTSRHFMLRLFYHSFNLVRRKITWMFLLQVCRQVKVIFNIFRNCDPNTHVFPTIENKTKNNAIQHKMSKLHEAFRACAALNVPDWGRSNRRQCCYRGYNWVHKWILHCVNVSLLLQPLVIAIAGMCVSNIVRSNGAFLFFYFFLTESNPDQRNPIKWASR